MLEERLRIPPPCGSVTSAETSDLMPGTSLVIHNLLLLLLESKYTLKNPKEKALGALLIALYYKTVITSHQAAGNFNWCETLKQMTERGSKCGAAAVCDGR